MRKDSLIEPAYASCGHVIMPAPWGNITSTHTLLDLRTTTTSPRTQPKKSTLLTSIFVYNSLCLIFIKDAHVQLTCHLAKLQLTFVSFFARGGARKWIGPAWNRGQAHAYCCCKVWHSMLGERTILFVRSKNIETKDSLDTTIAFHILTSNLRISQSSWKMSSIILQNDEYVSH